MEHERAAVVRRSVMAGLGAAAAYALAACGSAVHRAAAPRTSSSATPTTAAPSTTSTAAPASSAGSSAASTVAQPGAPKRFTIRPDDYHVPYAGTAADGRRFFLSEELFGSGGSYVGVFLWKADGAFDEVRVDAVKRPPGLPPGQAGPAGPQALVLSRLAELGHYTLEPIDVEPFLTSVDGEEFGWRFGSYDDGTPYLNIEPGDFICYYEPFDGREYDT